MRRVLPFTHNIAERPIEGLKEYLHPEVFIEYCKACKYYNKIWTCPPFDFETAEQLKGFEYAYIIGSKLYLKDLEGSMRQLVQQEDAGTAFNEVYEAARKALDEKLTALGDREKQLSILLAGRCLICDKCAKENQLSCIHPEKAHYSLESLGFDVATVSEEILGYKLQWPKDGLPEHLTLVSAILSRDKLDIKNLHNSIK